MSSQVFDYVGLCDRVAGRVDIIESLIDLLLSTYPADRDELRELADRGDAAGLRELAHRLKGQLQTLGVDCAAEAALKLELMGRESDLSGADEALTALDFEMTRFQSAIADQRRNR